MRSYLAVIAVTWVLLGTSTAYGAEDQGHFFLFAAPGSASATAATVQRVQLPAGSRSVHVGGGGEGAVTRTWGVGTDIGGLTRPGGKTTVATISLDSFYHPIGQRRQGTDPYVTAGYGWMLSRSTDERLGLPNVGGGLNYWMAERGGYKLGLTVDVHGYFRGGRNSLTYQEIRIGVALRQ